MGLFLLNAVGILLSVQATPATVTGVVRSGTSGEPLAGAIVSLTDLNRATATDENGRYTLRQVSVGPQHLTIRFIGHAPRTLHALVPPDGELEINVALHPTPLRLTTVDVRPRVGLRGVDIGDSASFPDHGTSIAAVRNHPVLAEPDVFQALAGGHVVLASETPSGVHIRGGASDQTAYLLDGIPVFSPYHAAGVFSAWNPDALDRLHLASAAPSPADPAALSGVIEAVTRVPGERHRANGSVSTTQSRLTFDGPLGADAAGYLVSLRSGFPGPIGRNRNASYLRGETGDWMAKLEVPALGGQVRMLGYGSANEISTAAQADAERAPRRGASRNVFEWHGRSLGAEWRRDFSGMVARILVWRAASDAGSVWARRSGRVSLTAGRRDDGLLAVATRGSAGGTSAGGIRIERSATWYRIAADSGGSGWRLSGRTPVATAFAQHAVSVGRHVDLELGASLAAAGHDQRFGPSGRLAWRPTDRLTLSGSYARLHQFAQSLRNAESVVSTVFPADLYMGAGAPGIPVARSDQGVIAADYRPFTGARVGVQTYVRDFDGLLLVAPRGGEPFATGPFAVGAGAARGVSVDAALSTARMGFVASYGLQRVRIEDGDSSYVPQHGAMHLLEGGVIVFPTPTWSIRLGVISVMGRRTTAVSGGLEWEGCNLLDAGCEFAGSPGHDGESLGATPLPAYVRADLGVRKHWHVPVAGRELLIAVFGTVTNVFDRRNVLTYARDSSTGEPFGIAMRPLAPLVVGVDWQF